MTFIWHGHNIGSQNIYMVVNARSIDIAREIVRSKMSVTYKDKYFALEEYNRLGIDDAPTWTLPADGEIVELEAPGNDPDY